MRTIRPLYSVALALAALAACGGPAPAQRVESRPTAVGLPAPVLIQVENSPASRPQSGLAAADVVFEYVTEGGISRFSAMYLHPPAGRVGPVRSARLVTIALATHLGALLVYSGAGTYVQQHIEQSGVVRFDENGAGQDLFRISQRISPHNLYTDGSRIADLLTRARAPRVSWRLWQRTATPPTGAPARTFRVPISLAETPVWTYDAALGGYTRREPDSGALMDADSGNPVLAATVIVEQVAITTAPEVEDVNGVRGVEQDVVSGGPAQVFTAGREYDATWSQPPNGPPRFTLKKGSQAPISRGEVWIELVARGEPATVG
jgi:Protein of unknown function (DUF3048) N-terminal domain/Protein of unknown function (DUF3048) C-terminal domain